MMEATLFSQCVHDQQRRLEAEDCDSIQCALLISGGRRRIHPPAPCTVPRSRSPHNVLHSPISIMPRVPVRADIYNYTHTGCRRVPQSGHAGLSGEESNTQRDVSVRSATTPRAISIGAATAATAISRIAIILFSRIVSFGFGYTEGTVESRRYAVLFVNSVAPPPSRVRDARRALLALRGRGAQKITRGNSGCIAAARPRLAGLETPLMPTWLRA